ncbi:MAG TPA: hypothetical protein PKC28_03610 [Bdellovibrionales bacterium]|nr:hypothetical protein [Bdellovibrionales bacterium]
MTTRLRLDTFILRDKFGWNRQQILAEANHLASQHADLMGWKSIEVNDITGIPAKDGEHLCYSFEIWGVGTPSLQGGEEQDLSSHSTLASPHAAKQPEL